MSHSHPSTPPTLAGIRYPTAGLSKLLFRAPLVLWRMGLGWALPHNFLVLTTSGRKSGMPRHTMVEHWVIDGEFYFTSGWGNHAQWYKNLLADPIVTVQTARHGTVTGRATRAQDDTVLTHFFEHAAGTSPVWKPYLTSLDIEPTLEDFLAKKERVSVIRVEPVDAVGPAPLRADLTGLWIVVGLGLIWLLRPRR